MSDSNREWGESTDEAIARRNQADAIGRYPDGKLIQWQCGCRQNGGVQVQACKPPQTEAEMRAAFEAFISDTPFEMSIERWPDWEKYAWPGHYKRIEVQIAWAAWQAASEVKQ